MLSTLVVEVLKIYVYFFGRTFFAKSLLKQEIFCLLNLDDDVVFQSNSLLEHVLFIVY